MDAKWFTRDVAELRLWRCAGVVEWSSIAPFVAVRRRRASRARSPPSLTERFRARPFRIDD